MGKDRVIDNRKDVVCNFRVDDDDREFENYYAIDSGFIITQESYCILAGDSPLVGGISANHVLCSGSDCIFQRLLNNKGGE